MGYACELNGLDEANINDVSIILSVWKEGDNIQVCFLSSE